MKNENQELLTAGIVGVGTLVSLPLFIVGAILLAPLLGALSGWVLGLTFVGTWISQGFAHFGFNVQPSELYQVGTAFGWVGVISTFRFGNKK